MRILSVRAKDVFSIGEAELDLAGRGLVLVNGFSHDENDPNGSGKSSLAHKSISWCLWGQTAIGAKADRVKRRGCKSAMAQVCVEGQDGATYRVTRTRGPNSLTLERQEGGEWTDLSQKLEKETQVLTDQVLGRNFQSWLQSDFFGQGRKLSYAELTPAIQKSVLDDILPLDKLATWEASAVAFGKQFDEEDTRLTREMQSLMGSSMSLSNVMEGLKFQYASAASITAGRIAELKAAIEQSEATQAKIMDEIRETDALLAAISTDLDAHCKSAEMNLKMHSAGWLEVDAKKKEGQQKVADWTRYVAVLETQKVAISDACPTCERDYEPGQLDKVKARNADIDAQLEQAFRTLSQAKDFYAHIQHKCDLYAKEIDSLKESVLNFGNMKARRDSLLKQRAVQVYMHNNASADILKNELESVLKRPNPLEETMAVNQANLDKIKADHAIVSAASAKVKAKAENVGFWRSAFKSGIKNLLYREITEFLNTRANYYMAEMGNPQLVIEFSSVKEQVSGAVKEDFNVNVQSATGGESYDMLSGGEQQLSSFAIGLALADLAGSQAAGQCRFMVLDEPFTNLGPTNSERLIDFIQRILVPRKDTILLISNEPSLQQLIASQIFVEKRDGITSLGGAQ